MFHKRILRQSQMVLDGEWAVLNPPSPTVTYPLHDVVTIEAMVHRTFPDGQDLATPQALVAAFEQYRVSLADASFRGISVPVIGAHQLRVFDRGMSAHTNDDGVLVATAFHCEGAFRAHAAVPVRDADVYFPGEGPKKVKMVRGEAVCALAVSLLRTALRSFQAFGCYSALSTKFWITHRTNDGICLPHPLHYNEGGALHSQHLLGPAKPNVHYSPDLAWATEGEGARVEEELVRRFASTFNVRDEETIQSFIEGVQHGVNTSVGAA